MKTITYFALVAVFGFLISCAMNPMAMDMTQAVQSAKTRSDHDALAKHYEDAAKEMQARRMSTKNYSLNTRREKVFTASRPKV